MRPSKVVLDVSVRGAWKVCALRFAAGFAGAAGVVTALALGGVALQALGVLP